MSIKASRAQVLKATPAGVGGGNGSPGSSLALKAASFDTREYGVTGLRRWGGQVREEFLPELQGDRGRKVIREMVANDPVVGAILYATEQLVRQVTWRVEPPAGADQEDLRWTEVIRGALFEDMSATWSDTLAERLTMLPWGFEVAELVYKRRNGSEGQTPGSASRFTDGLIGWRKWPTRAQESLYEWTFDPEGGVQAMVQQDPSSARTFSIPIEKALLFRTSIRKGNPEGVSILRTAYRCFSEDTEILTRAGWKLGVALTLEDEVATLNPETGALGYAYPKALHVYEHAGTMIRASSRFLDLLVTPNHRMWVRRDHLDAYEFIEAAKVTASASYKQDALWEGKERASHTVPEYQVKRCGRNREMQPSVTVPMDDWLEFLGYFISEGYTTVNRRRSLPAGQAEVGLVQKEGPKATIIRACLSRLPWRVCERANCQGIVKFSISSRSLWAHLRPLGRSRVRVVPDYVKELSPRQIQIFLDAHALGDGSRSGGGMIGEYGPYEGTVVRFTASSVLADDLGELILKAGGCPRWRLQKPGGRFSWRPQYVVVDGSPKHQLRATLACQEYAGLVWCPTTECGVVYVRRNGKACWSGNSWLFKKRMEEIEGIGVERDLAGYPTVTVDKDGPDLWNTADSAATAQKAAVELFVRNVRRDAAEGAVLPWWCKFELVSTGSRRAFDTNAIIQRYEQRIAMASLADFILLGHEKVGSFALASSKTSLFSLALGSYMDAIAAVVNRHAIPRLLALNGRASDRAPTLVHGDVEAPDLQELGTYITALAGAGAPLFPDPNLEAALRTTLLAAAGAGGGEEAVVAKHGGRRRPGARRLLANAEDGDAVEDRRLFVEAVTALREAVASDTDRE